MLLLNTDNDSQNYRTRVLIRQASDVEKLMEAVAGLGAKEATHPHLRQVQVSSPLRMHHSYLRANTGIIVAARNAG